MEQSMNTKGFQRIFHCISAACGRIELMLIFAISLLFTIGAAFSILVIVGMIAGNWAAIRSALAGQGAFGAAIASNGSPPHRLARVSLGPVRHGRGQQLRRAAPATSLRAAA
jgi:hypothetical protein